MRYFLLLLSLMFATYGLLPYKKASNIDTRKPNQLIIDQQECGCPCPDALVVKGELQIPPNLLIVSPALQTSQINLEIDNFNEQYNFDLGHARLFVSGKVIGADTLMCEPTKCELAPRFKVESWGLVEYVARAWMFPGWALILFIINVVIFIPALVIIEIVKQIRNRERVQKGS